LKNPDPESEQVILPVESSSRMWILVRLLAFFLFLAGLLFLLFSGFAPGPEKIQQLIGTIDEPDISLPMLMVLFVVMGSVGTPQFVLIGASIVVFGPVEGGFYAWTGTMIGAMIHFWIGRWIGFAPLQRFGGKTLNRISSYVGKNGFWSSLVMRMVPSGPFVLVNIAFGLSKARFASFAGGTAIGILPKIMVLALVAKGLVSYADTRTVVLPLAMAAIAIGISFVVWQGGRRWKRSKNSQK
jgi:uncharacterized membrane protein YdjX (TVP38/TMEM64 family)